MKDTNTEKNKVLNKDLIYIYILHILIYYMCRYTREYTFIVIKTDIIKIDVVI
jgi:hypothetical protein